MVRKLLFWILVTALILGMGMISGFAEEAPGTGLDSLPFFGEPAEGEKADWTVLLYFCGSDLESKYSYASGNLKEVLNLTYPQSVFEVFADDYAGAGINPDDYEAPGTVNILLETGGCKEWHTEDMAIDINSLQRWQFRCRTSALSMGGNHNYFELKETLPLASMADPETLADFIRWGVATYPAEKYVLVLWDHGGGAMTGLFVDELFNNETMYLNELEQALKDGGTVFETLIIDACLMANMETAAMVRNYARWMVASEEEVPGGGTALGAWLLELYTNPKCDGQQLGRTVCDLTMRKYANHGDNQARATLTWSVIDLSKIDRVISAMDSLFRTVGEIYVKLPEVAAAFANSANMAEEYGNSNQCMRDIASLVQSAYSTLYLQFELRNELKTAVENAVEYNVRGMGRSQALGLSFCYPVSADTDELKTYAQNCPSPYYLAFLDAVTDWEAPDELYTRVDRLPAINTIEDLQIDLKKVWTADGFPGLQVDGPFNNLSGIYYHLYMQDGTTSQIVRLGRTDCMSVSNENYESVFYAYEPWRWPYIDDVPCDIELVQERYRESYKENLYNINIQIGTDIYQLRCGRQLNSFDKAKRSYEVYGIWEGYNETTEMSNRYVTNLAELAGREYRLLWLLDRPIKDNKYMPAGTSKRLYRTMDVVEEILPEGTYFLEYEADDMFLRPATLGRIEMYWDGEKMTFPEDFTWEGTVRIKWTGNE